MGQRAERLWWSQTDAYESGTYSNPTVVHSHLPSITLSYDSTMLKSYADPTTPTIIDVDTVDYTECINLEVATLDFRRHGPLALP